MARQQRSPCAKIVADRFHVIRLVNQHLHESLVRRAPRRSQEPRALFLRSHATPRVAPTKRPEMN
ncbi:transposase [Haliea sp.]|uniref:transposase n=1 Tax=Haliea sp. TaxID=1932666 RepID=UPI0035278BA9